MENRIVFLFRQSFAMLRPENSNSNHLCGNVVPGDTEIDTALCFIVRTL